MGGETSIGAVCIQAPFLCHIVSRDGLVMDPAKIEAIKKMGQPKTKKDMRIFLGMAGYYRTFMKDFSNIVGPLHELTKKKLPGKAISGMMQRKRPSRL